MKKRDTPSRESWGDIKADVDLPCAFRELGGKTIAEAAPILEADPSRIYHFLHASDEVFAYYILCLADFLVTDESQGAAECASTFLNAVHARMSKRPGTFGKNYTDIKQVIDKVSSRQGFYDADHSIYGSFSDLRQKIEELHSAYRLTQDR